MANWDHPTSKVRSTVLGLPEQVRACLFDLDGVLTDTASVHAKAWQTMFDTYLYQRAKHTGENFVPFDPTADYRQYVDGKKREDGVRSFLGSRGITLPEGSADNSGDVETIYGLGNRKDDLFRQVLKEHGIEVFDGSRRYLEAITYAGLGVAVVSSSTNTRDVLKITGLDRFVQQQVDGITLREEHIAGKPAPDSYLRGAQLLDVAPDTAAVFEDALSGVQAGLSGHFGFVVGINRTGRVDQAEELRRIGANVVVTDLAELL